MTNRPKSLLAVALCALALPSLLNAQVPSQSKRIDQLVEDGYKANKVVPNDPATDELFLRRVYLDTIGRIPTQKEAETFYNYEGAGKRAKVIEYLLQSEGWVSHSYNYWADILRIKSQMNGETGGAYVRWVKEALRANTPYDEFVRKLITAEGYIWDNGAVGYYMRDAGMPLDNMSNTTQIFLGTQLVCAQCHNHPFDVWERKDYYQMAAFTYGVETRISATGDLGIDKIVEDEAKRRKGLRMTGNMRRALDDILQPLSYGAQSTDRKLNIPGDYQYDDDVKPNEMVKPASLFGDDIRLGKRDTSGEKREKYAEWMTGPENPRFTRVIVNRLWKRAMGMGLVEPVDDFREDTVGSNPKLMDYLVEIMKSKRYDMREFMRIVYNTRTYQRMVTMEEVPPDQPYHFQGPLLHRMSAEQLWDSYMTLALPDVDDRTDEENARNREYNARKQADVLRTRKGRDILDQAEKIAAAMDEFDGIAKGIRAEMAAAQEADDQPRLKILREQLNAADSAQREQVGLINKHYSEMVADGGMMGGMMAMSDDKMAMMGGDKDKKKAEKPADDRWKGYGGHLMRASELPSPAPNGHFLREYGQSDRDTIQNSHKNASVAQALLMLNSNLSNDILNGNSAVMKSVAAAMTPEEKTNAAFLCTLSRLPTEDERALVASKVAEKGDKGYEDVVFALMNTSEFAFVQ